MSTVIPLNIPDADKQFDLFERIAKDIYHKGYSLQLNALSASFTEQLWMHVQSLTDDQFVRAGVGREQKHVLNKFVRTDQICWINGESAAGLRWLQWAGELQTYLNRQLLLGLFSFESHFAHYGPGDFYKKHLDAFKGEANRVLSLVLYLNPGWQPDDGGELKMYLGDQNDQTINITPAFGTLVAFLSEDFPHEVLPANRDRYSIAGWYRLNTSTTDRVDPPV